MRKASGPPALATLILMTATSTVTLNMIVPSLANIARDLDADYALVSLALGGYLAVTAAVQLAVGPLSDRIGRRPVLLAALAVFTLASLGCATAGTVWMLLAFRMLQAAVVSGYVLSLAIVRDTAGEAEAARLLGRIGMAMALAPMLGPMLGSVLDAAFGWRMVFLLYAAAGVGLLGLAWADLGETNRPSAGAGHDGRRLTALLREPAFWCYALCTAFSTGAFYVFLAGAPLVATVFGIGTAELGVFVGSITAGFMAGSWLASRLAGRHPPTTVMLIGRMLACLPGPSARPRGHRHGPSGAGSVFRMHHLRRAGQRHDDAEQQCRGDVGAPAAGGKRGRHHRRADRPGRRADDDADGPRPVRRAVACAPDGADAAGLLPRPAGRRRSRPAEQGCARRSAGIAGEGGKPALAAWVIRRCRGGRPRAALIERDAVGWIRPLQPSVE
ncbi:MFS transporter [Inquilinus limosus]|uniref:MFS transporter n=1 Tax=Inquilinus limosus TaxID=171674 RepID=UPI001B7FAED0|nr:MFS transporter [Inquilinus limosus]